MANVSELDPISPTQASEKRKHKLGYQRTAIACNHCRKRKIRCLLDETDQHGRCQNCLRLSKDCSFLNQNGHNKDQDRLSARSQTMSQESSFTSPSPDVHHLSPEYEGPTTVPSTHSGGYPYDSGHGHVYDRSLLSGTATMTNGILPHMQSHPLTSQWPSPAYSLAPSQSSGTTTYDPRDIYGQSLRSEYPSSHEGTPLFVPSRQQQLSSHQQPAQRTHQPVSSGVLAPPTAFNYPPEPSWQEYSSQHMYEGVYRPDLGGDWGQSDGGMDARYRDGRGYYTTPSELHRVHTTKSEPA